MGELEIQRRLVRREGEVPFRLQRYLHFQFLVREAGVHAQRLRHRGRVGHRQRRAARLGADARPQPADGFANSARIAYIGVRVRGVVDGARRQRLDAPRSRLERVGSETLIYSKVAGRSVVSQVRERYNFRPGDEVALAIDLERVHVFDKETGARLDAE